MRTIGVRDLKANLSRTLHDVQAGEHFLVTDRGRVVAELKRPDATTMAATPAQLAIARLAARGVLRMAEAPMRSFGKPAVNLPDGSWRELLDAEREDR